jgi:hypothetical protein
VTNSHALALAEILAEAKRLKIHRTDGVVYFEKCDHLVERIKSVFNEMRADELEKEDFDKMKSIKELMQKEELYAQSSADFRDPQKWLGSLDD